MPRCYQGFQEGSNVEKATWKFGRGLICLSTVLRIFALSGYLRIYLYLLYLLISLSAYLLICLNNKSSCSSGVRARESRRITTGRNNLHESQQGAAYIKPICNSRFGARESRRNTTGRNSLGCHNQTWMPRIFGGDLKIGSGIYT